MIRVSILLSLTCLLPLSVGAQERGTTLHAAFLRSVAPGEIASERWKVAQEDEVEANVDDAKTALRLVSRISSDDAENINEAFEMRHGLLRWRSPSFSVEEVVESHPELIEVVQRISFPASKTNLQQVGFGQITSEQLTAFWQLVTLATAHSAGQDQFDRASSILAGGFAASRWWQRADSYETTLRALVLEERLQRGILDLQAIGGPIVSAAIESLHETMPSTEAIQRTIWSDLSNDLPIFRDKPRTQEDWQDDLKRTFEYYYDAPGTVAKFMTIIDSERVGERLRRDAATRLQAVELGHFIKTETQQAGGDPPQGAHPLEDRMVAIVSSGLDDALIAPLQIARKLSMDARQRLLALQCIEAIREESRDQGKWIDKLEPKVRDGLPNDPRSGSPFTVKAGVFDGIGYPYYNIQLTPESGGKPQLIEVGPQAKYGKDNQ